MDTFATLLLLALLAMLVAYLTRGTSVRRLHVVGADAAPPDPRSDNFNMHLSLLTETHVTGGNKIDILLNGEQTFDRLWDELGKAETVICLHVYLMVPGEVADTLLRVLSERAQAGVEVYVLLDAVGAGEMSKDYRRRLLAAGANVEVYRPLRFKTIYKFQQRMHMRAVIVDGRVGFTGGFGIGDQWLGDGRHPDQWRDTNVRVEGAVAMQLHVAFSTNWAEATGDLLVGEAVVPMSDTPDASEPQAAGVMSCSPTLGATNAERFFFLAIATATERIYITTAYFVPTRDLRWLLMNAADRGVDVRVINPGANTDQLTAWHASRALYSELIAAGVRVFEYEPTMIHAKTFVADTCWATIGTFNFDNRSMKLNDEVALVIRDDDVAKELERAFIDDLEHSREITAEDCRLSGSDWLKSRLARLASPIL